MWASDTGRGWWREGTAGRYGASLLLEKDEEGNMEEKTKKNRLLSLFLCAGKSRPALEQEAEQ